MSGAADAGPQSAKATCALAPLASPVAGACSQQEADGEQAEDERDSPAAFDGRRNRDQQRADGGAQ